jgi:Spy/CpxP family protein refolding chaperone
MKKTLLTALIISASVSTTFAQDQKQVVSTDITVVKDADQKSPEVKRAQDWQNTLATELKLTDEQSKKIAELDKAFGERRQAIHNNAILNDEAKKERKMALLKAKEAQFAKLLTPEQQARYKELVAAKTEAAPKTQN